MHQSSTCSSFTSSHVVFTHEAHPEDQTSINVRPRLHNNVLLMKPVWYIQTVTSWRDGAFWDTQQREAERFKVSIFLNYLKV